MGRSRTTPLRLGAAALLLGAAVVAFSSTGAATGAVDGGGGGGGGERPAAVGASAVELAVEHLRYADPQSVPGKGVFSAEEEAFLDDLTRRGVQFFVDTADPVSGLMPDRAKADGSAAGDVSSIASVGFGLTALCIGHERGWLSRDEAYDRSLKVLKFLRDHCQTERGHFYHFLNMRTGARTWECEASNVDTALLMAGVITARQHFPDTELAAIADELYQRVEWDWMATDDGTLCMGSKPETGFLEHKWDHYSEGAPLIVLLGLGSKKHPLPASAWHAWRRDSAGTYAGLTYLQCPPLFTHQYPQLWFDLRGLRDDYADYFRNSQLATIAQRQWMAGELSRQFSTYGPDLWGLTASDTAHGYRAWGGPPPQDLESIDGSLVPCAPGGSLAFSPRLCVDALRAMHAKFGDKAYLKYGFVDAFNPATGWYNADVLGIDVGATVLAAENARSGFVWRTFMSAPEAQAALKAAGFRPLAPADRKDPTNSVFKATQRDGR
jgi:hypothetical protein